MNKILIGFIVLVFLIFLLYVFRSRISIIYERTFIRKSSDSDLIYDPTAIAITNNSGCNKCYCGEDPGCCALFVPPYESSKMLEYDMPNGFIQTANLKEV
jgi:hypothetical protein